MEKTSEEKVKMEGTVKFFNKLKGFGFVKGDDERDYFVHITAIEQGKYLQEGDRVSFDGVEDEKGLKAQNIKFLSKGAPLEEEKEESGEESSEEEQPAEESAEEPAEEAQEESTEEKPEESEAEETPAEEPAEEEQPAEEPTEEETPAEESDEEKKEE